MRALPALDHPIMNAAGTCKSLEDVRLLARSSVAAVMVGSITKEPREQNDGVAYWSNDAYSLNSLGLPNRGLDYYREHLGEMADLCHGAGKPLFLSVAPFGIDELREILEAVAGMNAVDAIEINLGCPNVWAAGAQKRIFCFDLGYVESALVASEPVSIPVGLKVSPLSDPEYLRELAVKVDGRTAFVTAINTFPNAYSMTDGKPDIGATEGFAGLAGPALKPIALGQVAQYHKLLRSTPIVAAGGVTTGRDVADYLAAGATIVQLNTAFANRGIQVFSTILEEYLDGADM
jgi:dihydroorotate dehydrogenase (fumarate)